VSKTLIELRDLLEREIDEIAGKQGDAPTQDVIAAIRLKAPGTIRECSSQLENIAVTVTSTCFTNNASPASRFAVGKDTA
jgi:hypothetical protein